jgi:transcriptional regulator GlxA family with amidase domain
MGRFIMSALSLIHREYARALEVQELARETRLSVSSFFEAFKAPTSSSPVQHVKEIRLNRPRQRMIWGD